MRIRAAIASFAIVALSACASPTSYAGISLIEGDADPHLQSLASRAQSGSRQARLELGIRYEEGRGVPLDLSRAKSLYRSAAADSGGTIWVYVPSVGETPGRVMPVDTGPKQYGLAEAKRRLKALQ